MTLANTPAPARRLPRFLLLVVALLLLAAIPSAHAQLAHPGPAAAIALSKTVAPYDVASIKQNTSDAQSGDYNIDDHGIFTATNMPLEAIIEFAYDIRSDQIAGLSGPVSSAHFDITAKVIPPDGTAPHMLPDSQLQAMIIPLLTNRFHLKAHLQPRIMPVYDLVVAHGGPKIKLSQVEAVVSSWNVNGENTDKVLTGKGSSMSDLASMLSDVVQRKVIDKTGLTGHADITLKWTDDVATEQGSPNGVSIFTAIEEQLGLKLQPSKGPVDTLVIDHVEMPSEN